MERLSNCTRKSCPIDSQPSGRLHIGHAYCDRDLRGDSLAEMRPIPTHYRVDDANVAWRVADDEAVVLHAESSAYFGLNQTATLLWEQLAEHPLTRDQLMTWARSHFPDVPVGAQSEIDAFIDQLQAGDLIVSEESTATAAPDTGAGETSRRAAPPWEAPVAERFGELEKLILSGE